jgi:hypothetical protein
MSSLYEPEKTDIDFGRFSAPDSALTDESILVDSSISFAIAAATLLDGKAFLWCAAGPAHCRSALLDDVTGVGMAVLVALRTTSRIVGTVKHRRVAVLACGGRSTLAAKPLQKPSEHASVLPGRRYTYASRRIRLVA